MDKVATKQPTAAKSVGAEKKTYSFDEAYAASKEYFFGDILAANVWCNKYAMRSKDGEFLELTPHDMHDRLAGEFARIDSEKYGLDYDERFKIYREAMNQFSLIVPQGSPMAAVGNTEQIMSASNCVVVEPPHDSIAGIMKTGAELAQLYKRRCGVGTDLSELRPDGFPVNNAARTTSGAWSFADYYSYITRMIGQSGRRGALMLTLDVHHPDVEKFATMKADLSKVTGANVSIRLSDEFMTAVENDTTYEQRWPCEGIPQITQQVDARKVWETIIEMATKTAEPGLIFWDKITGRLPAHSYPQFKTRSCNPCAEIALSSYDSCRLLSLNLTGFVRDAFIGNARFDFDTFRENVCIAQQMVDNLVDIELQLIEKIQSVCSTDDERELWQKLWQAGHDGRRTGLGTHGLGDMLAQIGIKYDSQEALDFGDKLYEVLRDAAYSTSVELAEIRGSFPAFDWEIEKDNEYIRDLPKPIRKRMAKSGRRNISLLTQAPTGTVSLVSKCGEFDRHNVSSGVEPVFRNNFTRRKRINVGDNQARVDHTDDLGDQWQEFEVYHGNVLNYFEKTRGVDLSNLEKEESQQLLKELMKELPDYFTTSDQVDWKFRVELQGTEQHYIDHSISSTVNLPRGTSPDVVSEIYLEGWRQGLKGVTVYVDGSRDGVLISKDSKTTIDTTQRPTSIVRLQAPKRPKELEAEIHHHTVKGEKWIAIVGLLDGDPYEMFGGYSSLIHLPKKCKHGTLKRRSQGKYDLHIPIGDEELILKDILGTFNDDEIGWTTRLVSTSLRHGVPLEFLTEQLLKAGGGFNSFSKVLARVMKKYIPDGAVKSSAACQGTIKTEDGEEITCNSTNLKWQEGCPACADCGYTKCN